MKDDLRTRDDFVEPGFLDDGAAYEFNAGTRSGEFDSRPSEKSSTARTCAPWATSIHQM